MVGSKRKKRSSVLSSLYNLEQGREIPDKLSWRAEVTALSHLRTSATNLTPTIFNGLSIDPAKIHKHVVQIAASPDGALLAVAGSDGQVEVHEPDGGDTRRLSLMPHQTRVKVSSCAWFSHGGSDTILLSFLNRPQVWVYDLATCRIDTPCRKFDFSSKYSSSRLREQASDLYTIDQNCCAVAVARGEVVIFDSRVKSSTRGRIATIRSGMVDAVLAGDDMLLYSADAGHIAVFDRRCTPGVNNPAGRGMQVAGGRSSVSKSEVLRKHIAGSRGFNFIKVLPDSPQGFVAYQTMDGAVGYADMAVAGDSGVHVPESGTQPVLQTEMGLMQYGVTERALEYPWHILRRRGDVIRGVNGRGWRVVAPIVGKTGIRMLSLGPGYQARAFEIPVREYVSCVHALDNSLERLVLAGAKNNIGMMSVSLGRSKDTSDSNVR